MKAVKAKGKKENKQHPSNTISFFTFYNLACLQTFFTDEYYPSGYFFLDGHYGVSLRLSNIASRDQFKPIGIGENLVVNYN